MFEKVNPMHPDKIADRIAGSIVDLAYSVEKNPKIAVEVLIGHGVCNIIIEASVTLNESKIRENVWRITQDKFIHVNCLQIPQDYFLSENQHYGFNCGDNGIFKGMPLTEEESHLTKIAHEIYNKFRSDGKYIYDQASDKLIICQSKASSNQLAKQYKDAIINPLGDWTGGIDVDSGATNRKLGSDMGRSVTGGGLHGKDLSKADVSVNIYAFLKAQELKEPVELFCAIGDSEIDGKPYSEIVEIARKFINKKGGFEKFAEWGLIN